MSTKYSQEPGGNRLVNDERSLQDAGRPEPSSGQKPFNKVSQFAETIGRWPQYAAAHDPSSDTSTERGPANIERIPCHLPHGQATTVSSGYATPSSSTGYLFASDPTHLQATTSTAESAPAPAYKCVLCTAAFTIRKCFVRHLKDQHVAQQYFRCPTCKLDFLRPSGFMKHAYECRFNGEPKDFRYRRTLDVYVCPFTGVYFGASMKNYVKHLVDLSADFAVDETSRPVPRRDRKMMVVLEHACLQQPLQEASIRHFGAADAWKAAEWNDEGPLAEAIRKVEEGSIDLQPSSHAGASMDDLRSFLNALFSTSRLPRQAIHEGNSSSTYPLPELADASSLLVGIMPRTQSRELVNDWPFNTNPQGTSSERSLSRYPWNPQGPTMLASHGLQPPPWMRGPLCVNQQAFMPPSALQPQDALGGSQTIAGNSSSPSSRGQIQSDPIRPGQTSAPTHSSNLTYDGFTRQLDFARQSQMYDAPSSYNYQGHHDGR